MHRFDPIRLNYLQLDFRQIHWPNHIKHSTSWFQLNEFRSVSTYPLVKTDVLMISEKRMRRIHMELDVFWLATASKSINFHLLSKLNLCLHVMLWHQRMMEWYSVHEHENLSIAISPFSSVWKIFGVKKNGKHTIGKNRTQSCGYVESVLSMNKAEPMKLNHSGSFKSWLLNSNWLGPRRKNIYIDELMQRCRLRLAGWLVRMEKRETNMLHDLLFYSNYTSAAFRNSYEY